MVLYHLTMTLWTTKINNTNLHFFPYKMGLIVFFYLAPKEFFLGAKLNNESETVI